MLLKFTTITSFLLIIGMSANAQLYSNGNNAIPGNSVGIGTSSPGASLHIKETTSGPGMSSGSTSTTNGYHPMLRFNASAGSTQYYWDFMAEGGSALKFKFKQNTGSYATKLSLSPTTLNLYTDKVKHTAFEAGTSNTPVNSNGSYIALGMTHQGGNTWSGKGAAIMTTTNGSLYFIANDQSSIGSYQDLKDRTAVELKGNGVFNIKSQLQVGSNTVPSGAIASFSGGHVYSEKYICKSSGNWPDYVFESNYELTPILEVENYIDKHQHLPGVPAAQQIDESGVDLEKMNNLLLEKVEELTLYVIDLQKQLNELKKD